MDKHCIDVSDVLRELKGQGYCTYSNWYGKKGSDIDIFCKDIDTIARLILWSGPLAYKVVVTRYPSQIHIDCYMGDGLELRFDLHGKEVIKRTFYQKLKARVQWLLR